MSHRAMNWALEQRQLKPSPWRVLVMLADRHNKDTLRVDPEQARLAHDCNMSRSTLNRQLADLENLGLIVRVERVDSRTNRQMATFYILALDFDHPPDVENAVSDYRTRIAQVQTGNIEADRVPEQDTEAVSQKSPEPCPKNGQFRVSKWDTNPVKELGRKPCAPVGPQTIDIDLMLERFCAVYPRIGDLGKTRAALKAAVDGGATIDQIVDGARAYAAEQKGNAPRFIAYSENWLRGERWRSMAPKPVKDDAQGRRRVLTQRAEAIKARAGWVARHVSDAAARELIELGLVSSDECRSAGLAP